MSDDNEFFLVGIDTAYRITTKIKIVRHLFLIFCLAPIGDFN